MVSRVVKVKYPFAPIHTLTTGGGHRGIVDRHMAVWRNKAVLDRRHAGRPQVTKNHPSWELCDHDSYLNVRYHG